MKIYLMLGYMLFTLLFFNGCESIYGMKQGNLPSADNELLRQGFLDKLEKTQYVYEKRFNYPYKEVFLASLDVARDLGANIFMKDYDKGKIFAQPALVLAPPSGASVSMPGIVWGLYIQKVNDKETRVTLRAVRTLGYCTASAEDVFIDIEKEIQFRKKINE